MSNSNSNTPTPGVTNPLQTNNTLIAILAYAAGAAAQKFPIFDAATWNYLFMSLGGVLFVVLPAVFNRKSAIIKTVADLPEVKNEGGIVLDKNVAGATALANSAPANVVAK